MSEINQDFSQDPSNDGRGARFETVTDFPVALDIAFCFWETSVSTVKRSIESYRHKVRYIFAVDGTFKLLENEQKLSPDDVRQYLKSVPNVILIDAPDLLEHEKRMKYIEQCRKYDTDWLLIMDADEFVDEDQTDWDEFYSNLRRAYENIKGPKIHTVVGITTNHKTTTIPKLWLRPYLIVYERTHNFFRYLTDNTIWKSTLSHPLIRGMFTRGNDKERSTEYVKKVYAYQLKLMEYEKPIKDELRKVAKNTTPKNQNIWLPGVPMS